MLNRCVAFVLPFLAMSSARAQEAFNNALPKPGRVTAAEAQPESAWLDLRQNSPENSKTQSAPGWVESVTLVPGAAKENIATTTIFRIRVQPPSQEYQVLFARLFFDDKPNQRPTLVAWDESGTQLVQSGELGAAIDLPSSDTVMVPMIGASSIDVEVPGDGSTVRGIYLDWMKNSEVLNPLGAEHRDLIADPFSKASPLHAPSQDTERFGTVTATLASETIRIGTGIEQGAAFQFGLEAQPLLALISFEVASPTIDSPPEVYVNGENIGPVTLSFPELADPAYRGEMESLVRQMHFQYTGWLRAQKLVPVTSLKVGTNDVLVVGGAGTVASAIRATQIQLKYLWDKSDYLLRPTN